MQWTTWRFNLQSCMGKWKMRQTLSDRQTDRQADRQMDQMTEKWSLWLLSQLAARRSCMCSAVKIQSKMCLHFDRRQHAGSPYHELWPRPKWLCGSAIACHRKKGNKALKCKQGTRPLVMFNTLSPDDDLRRRLQIKSSGVNLPMCT